MVQHQIGRRSFLQLTGLAGLALATPATLAACGPGNSGTGASGAADGAILPSYLPYTGVRPDLAGSDTFMAAFYGLPAKPPAAFPKPPAGGGSVTAMVNVFGPPPPAKSHNGFWQALDRAVGTDLELNMVPDSDYPTKTSTVLAGGDLPDIMNLPLYTPRLGQVLPALFADLAPYLSGDKSHDYPYLANLPTDSWRPMVYDGHLFGVPVARMSTGTVIFTRSDILDDLSLDPNPGTWDDFVALAKDLTSETDKRWAFDDPHRLFTFAAASLGAPNTWQLGRSGEFVNMITSEAYADALDRTRQFITKGYLHPNGFSATFDQTRANFGTGACVFHSDGYLAWDILSASYPDIGIDALRPLKTPDGKAYQFTSAGALSLSAVRKGDEKSVRRSLEVLNWLASPFGTKEYLLRKYGVEGTHYTMSDGAPVKTALGTTETALPLQYVVDSAPVLGPGPRDRVDAQYDYHKTVAAELLEDPSIGLYSETYAKQGATLQKIVTDARTEILLGHRPVSSWADTVSQWKSSGGTAMGTEYTQAHAKNPR
ncbi:extracellular solute-binding protein [Actinophytocola oryzae]|uniref:Carbohydrate ABC transporter substrate-binding protein (CUT1 family) n=1 Tax=Actinophytocola oryzae TaxID=502181 RepID=A0A4R7VJR3_9PSEU|nr:extracellular solute-binding protein [Actinophytocola oryzae]TDV49690.1 carbohydrate ABC transporter substrate-binding protein (CUT1 family) [Actinophytocola oryzae]